MDTQQTTPPEFVEFVNWILESKKYFSMLDTLSIESVLNGNELEIQIYCVPLEKPKKGTKGNWYITMRYYNNDSEYFRDIADFSLGEKKKKCEVIFDYE
jgi:hypothetical protein